MLTASSRPEKDFLRKLRDAVVLQQIKERGALPMIDRGDIRQAIDRCGNIWASLLGRCYGCLSIRLTALIKIQRRAERQRDSLMYEQSHRDYLHLPSASSSTCHGLLIITVITPLPMPSATKNARELKLAKRGNYRRRRCVSVMLLRSGCKIHEGVS